MIFFPKDNQLLLILKIHRTSICEKGLVKIIVNWKFVFLKIYSSSLFLCIIVLYFFDIFGDKEMPGFPPFEQAMCRYHA